jgi:hypothetical protein
MKPVSGFLQLFFTTTAYVSSFLRARVQYVLEIFSRKIINFNMGDNDYPIIKDPVEAKFLPTSHGGRTLIDPYNYCYIKSKAVGDKIYWFCQRARSKILPYCPAKALTLGTNIQWTTGHNHGSDPVSVEVKAAEKRIWQVMNCEFHF